MSKSRTETVDRKLAQKASYAKYYQKAKEYHKARCAAYYQKTKSQKLPYKRLQVAEYRESNAIKILAARASSVAVKEQYLADLKKQPCTDCGISYPACVMDFDHIGAKRMGISQIMRCGYSLKVLKEEVAKCELVCANCHRIRTHITRK